MRIQREENLKQAIDYSQGQKDAAYCVLGEIVNLLGEFSDHMRIIGGWVPALLYPNEDHIGSIDVDVLLNQLEIRRAESYETIKRLLEKNGYRRHREKYFTFIKTVTIQGIDYAGGIRALTKVFLPYKEKSLVRDMCRKLKEKFASVEHAGPMDITAFLGIREEEDSMRIRQDAYQKVKYLTEKLEDT